MAKVFVITRQMLREFGGELWSERIEKIVRAQLGEGPLRVTQLVNGDYLYEQVPPLS